MVLEVEPGLLQDAFPAVNAQSCAGGEPAASEAPATTAAPHWMAPRRCPPHPATRAIGATAGEGAVKQHKPVAANSAMEQENAAALCYGDS